MKQRKRRATFSQGFVWVVTFLLPLTRTNAIAASGVDNPDSLPWTSEAQLIRFPKSSRGSLKISSNGVEFRPPNHDAEYWDFNDIRTLELRSRKLSLVTYENRRGLMRGDQPLKFKLKRAIPPEVASELVRLVGKPAINGLPVRRAASLATVGARHRTMAGGSSGVLRFRDAGIDYLAARGDDSRSWRWTDIETLAKPDPYRFRISGYLETFDFELKQPLPGDLFDRLWDHVYAHGLNTCDDGGNRHATTH